MKLAVDISQIVYTGSGVSRFTEGLVRAICEYDRTNDWTFFFSGLRQRLDPEIESLILNRDFKIVTLNLPPTLLSFLWNYLHVFSIDRFIGEVDWLITSDWTEPPSKNKKVTIVHDLIYMKYPETVDAQVKATQQKRMARVQKESKLIFADSAATKIDLMEHMQFPEKRIIVNYPGVTPLAGSKTMVKPQRPYILTVGKLEPRKNIERLVEAFQKLQRDDIDLSIVGMRGWGDVQINKSAHIKLLGFVEDSELANLYKNCLCFVMPSLYEGFGYPVVEAMSQGAPVTASHSSSLKEIGEDAVHYFDPLSTEQISLALEKLVNDKKLRANLSKKGKLQARKFTWKQYVAQLLDSLQSNENRN